MKKRKLLVVWAIIDPEGDWWTYATKKQAKRFCELGQRIVKLIERS